MINGFEYGFEDIAIVVEGKPFPEDGAVAIEYSTSKEHVNIMGRGSRPVAMGRGKMDFKGKITVLQSVAEAMQQSLPGGKNLTEKSPFNITVSYAPEGGTTVTDQLLFCRIKEVPKGMKAGDPNMEVELDLAIGDIQYNV